MLKFYIVVKLKKNEYEYKKKSIFISDLYAYLHNVFPKLSKDIFR